jgi:hypothetical protein
MILAVFSLLLLPPASALAKKKAPKPLVLEGVAADFRDAAGELAADQTKALKVAGRCVQDDRIWAREMENREPVTQTYETLAGAVVCWQGAEKKAGKLGDSFAAATRFIAARARYVETLRSFYFALTEKFRTGADGQRLCDRLTVALGEAGAANELGADLAAAFTNEDAKTMSAQLDADIKHWGEVVATEFKHQKCSK